MPFSYSVFKFFAVSTKRTEKTFLPMLYTSTNASILSYVKMFLYAKDLIPNIYRQHLNNSELHKYYISMHTNFCRKC